MEIVDTGLVFAYKPGIRTTTDYIILHHAAADGTVNDVHTYHRDVNGWSGIAYHFYIEKDGTVSKGRELDWRGGHATGYNGNSVGVCFEGNFENEEMSDTQLAAGKELVAYLRGLYPNAKIIRHKDVTGTACPGGKFPFDELIAADEEPSEWAKEAVQNWIDLGILQGDLEGKYGFKEPVSLERMIVLIERRFSV